MGTAAEVLIAGFVVSGDEPKRLLIRAIGPTLGDFGVTDVLADPQLALFRAEETTPIQQNDNWSNSSTAAEISTIAARLGAFALPSGSRDAVLLLDVEPGAYTAQVSGVGATTGIALLEIYDAP